MVAFWATLALNISDITRYAASQKDQIWGQFLGLPTTMTLYAFIGVAVTCAAIVIFDDILITQDAPWDPIQLIARFKDQPLLMVLAQIAILIATLSTNIAANVISPANSFANLYPKKISFKMGGLITGVLGILILPWKLTSLIVGFLLTYGAVLGPVVGVLIVDYYLIRDKELDLEGLYQESGPYQYTNGIHINAFISLFAGVSLVLSGLFIESLKPLYDMGWFSGFLISCISYLLLNKVRPTALAKT
jgi:NCS1 family nucleobase:cation symporter-1